MIAVDLNIERSLPVDIGFKKSFYVDGELTSPTLRHNYFMENDWLSEFQEYFFRTLGAASGLVAIPIAIGLGWLLLIFGSNIARNPELEEYQKCFQKVMQKNNEITQEMIANPDEASEIMKQSVGPDDLAGVCGERPKEWRWQ